MRNKINKKNSYIRIFSVLLGLLIVIVSVFSSPILTIATNNDNMLQNPSFEVNPWSGSATPSSHNVLATDIGWNSEDPGDGTTPAGYMELWGPGAFGPGRPGTVGGTKVVYPPYDGNFLCEINTTAKNTIWQNVTTKPGSLYKWGVAHRGRIGNNANPDVMQLTLNDIAQEDYTRNTTQFADGRGAWGTYFGYFQATTTTTKYSLESVSSGSGAVQSGSTASQPGEGNLVDNCQFITIADPAEVTITVGDNAPDNSKLVDNLEDTYTATPDTALPATYDTIGDYDVVMNVYQGAVLIGQITSIIHVIPLSITPTPTPNITPTPSPDITPTPTPDVTPTPTPDITPTPTPDITPTPTPDITPTPTPDITPTPTPDTTPTPTLDITPTPTPDITPTPTLDITPTPTPTPVLPPKPTPTPTPESLHYNINFFVGTEHSSNLIGSMKSTNVSNGKTMTNDNIKKYLGNYILTTADINKYAGKGWINTSKATGVDKGVYMQLSIDAKTNDVNVIFREKNLSAPKTGDNGGLAQAMFVVILSGSTTLGILLSTRRRKILGE